MRQIFVRCRHGVPWPRSAAIGDAASTISIRADVPRLSSAETMATSSFHNVGGYRFSVLISYEKIESNLRLKTSRVFKSSFYPCV